MRFLPSNNLAVSAKRFHEAGGFDAGFPLAGGEDREFCRRWLVTLLRNVHGKAARRLCSDALRLACLAEQDLNPLEFRAHLRQLAADEARPNLARSARWALRAWLAAQRQPCPPTVARPAFALGPAVVARPGGSFRAVHVPAARSALPQSGAA